MVNDADGECIETVEETCTRPPDDACSAMISVNSLQKTFSSAEGEIDAVNGVSFDIERGTAVGLLGPNGAGKTTTIKSLLGLVVPTSGRVRVNGIDVHENPQQAYRYIGALFEGARNTYWRLTVRENLSFFAALSGQKPASVRNRHEELLDQFALTEKADTPVRELSRGQQQKVSLACTLARDVSAVFLDEPTLGLDVESSLELRRELRDLVDTDGVTVLVSSHDMDVIEDLCDRVIIMNDGAIVADDSVENLLRVLHTNSYEITVTGPLCADTRDRLETSFNAVRFDRQADRTTFRARVAEDNFYELVDTLQTAGLSVTSFDTVQPDLEEVFLRLTDDPREEKRVIQTVMGDELE